MNSMQMLGTSRQVSMVAGVYGMVGVSLGLTMLLQYKAFQWMFMNTSKMVFTAINWSMLGAFVFTANQLAQMYDHDPARLSMSTNQNMVLICFSFLTFLTMSLSGSIMLCEQERTLDKSSQEEKQKDRDAASSLLALPLVYFVLSSSILLWLNSSLVAKGTVAISMLMLGTVIFYTAKQTSSTRVNRDGTDFNDTLMGSTRILSNNDTVLKRNQVDDAVRAYENLYAGARDNVGAISSDKSIQQRVDQYQTIVNSFYDLVTDFYEYGWGQSFHFAARFKDESFTASIARAEYFLASRLGLKEGMRCLDMGCGVGGPLRNIARFSGANIEGITINEYQVRVANRYNKEKGLGEQCVVKQGDFMNMPWEDETFDAVYAIESTCHAPNKTEAFTEAFRVMKKGAYFTGYEWVMVGEYDPHNAKHVELREGIEVGNGLPTIVTAEEVVQSLKDAGFEVIEHFDRNGQYKDAHQLPWFDTLDGKMTLQGFRMTRLGRLCTHSLVTLLETLRIAPKGTTRVHNLLIKTADDLVDAGKARIFTPDYYFLARKPLH